MAMHLVVDGGWEKVSLACKLGLHDYSYLKDGGPFILTHRGFYRAQYEHTLFYN